MWYVFAAHRLEKCGIVNQFVFLAQTSLSESFSAETFDGTFPPEGT